MGALTKEFRKISLVIFDRFIRTSGNPDEARLLAQASIAMPKDRTVVVVDSDLAYGNARALALDLNKTLEDGEILFIAYDDQGLAWAAENGISASKFSTKASEENAELWNALIRACVSIYDTHNWWRTRDQLMLRSLLEGSFKIQLWHGATGPVGKTFGLERLNTAKTFWHFSAVATSSHGFDVLVNEPKQAEYRRTRSMLAAKSIHDVEYRLVEPLTNGRWEKPDNVRLLIAPTYSESVEGEDALAEWIKEVAAVAKLKNWEIDIALHPGSKPRVSKLLTKVAGKKSFIQKISTRELQNYSAVITDFSGIAHDSLLCGVPTVSVLIDFENYSSLCPSLIDDEQMKCAYVVNKISELKSTLEAAILDDPLSQLRADYVESVMREIGALPGVNTREAVFVALGDLRNS